MNNDSLKSPRTGQTRTPKNAFLYGGLGVLLVALVSRWAGMAASCFWIWLGVAVALKTLFLISVFRAGKFKPRLWFCLILTGVGLILTSLLFKTVFPIPVLYKILFYGAISFKATGLVLMLLQKKRSMENRA
jgi:hypothetical protein